MVLKPECFGKLIRCELESFEIWCWTWG